jgi:hypothetical protein
MEAFEPSACRERPPLRKPVPVRATDLPPGRRRIPRNEEPGAGDAGFGACIHVPRRAVTRGSAQAETVAALRNLRPSQ